MKKLDNIVVESLNREHSKEIIKEFIYLGIEDKFNLIGVYDSYNTRYYGVIKGELNCYYKGEIKRYNPKVITLEQLKAMKEDKSEYPKLMWVSNNKICDTNEGLKRTVIACHDNAYWAINQNRDFSATKWKYAQDIEEALDTKQEVKTKVEFTGTLCMGDFQENTMTFEIEGDMTLQAGRYLISKIN